MHRPFLLSPCGHVACLDCLVSWFSSEVPGQGQQLPQLDQLPQQEQNQDEQQNEAERHQENQPGPDMQLGSIVGMAIPPPPQIPPLQPVAGSIVGMAIPPPPLVIPPPPQLPPLPPAPRPLAKRKKTCPQCRARITTRPVEVWFAKDMVASIVRSGLADSDAVPPSLRPGAPPLNINGEPEADPWKDIFPNKKDRDGGRRAREREMLREMREREWMGDRDDADGGVYRCIDCMTEIWEGVCAECGRVYRGHLPGARMSEFSDNFSDDDGEGSEGSEGEGEGDTDDDLGFMLGLHPNLRYLSESGSEGEGGFYGMPVQVTWTDDEMEPSDAGGSGSEGSESEGYESSFIDDGEREVVELVGSSDDEGEGEDVPRMRRAGRIGRRSNPYVISSGEEDESGGESPPVRRLGRREGGVIEVLSDEDEEEDEGSDDG
ncbi:hypothetical protein BC629DRAFT_59060 [Irpex lacteus]|nr:hypothetical protein BC629DRAFT_59060 [Irpex lacteus]